jgi:hypothetical protein
MAEERVTVVEFFLVVILVIKELIPSELMPNHHLQLRANYNSLVMFSKGFHFLC